MILPSGGGGRLCPWNTAQPDGVLRMAAAAVSLQTLLHCAIICWPIGHRADNLKLRVLPGWCQLNGPWYSAPGRVGAAPAGRPGSVVPAGSFAAPHLCDAPFQYQFHRVRQTLAGPLLDKGAVSCPLALFAPASPVNLLFLIHWRCINKPLTLSITALHRNSGGAGHQARCGYRLQLPASCSCSEAIHLQRVRIGPNTL
jgi:hypothetical protein